MFVGNIIEYNTVFNLEIKTSNWIDLSLNKFSIYG